MRYFVYVKVDRRAFLIRRTSYHLLKYKINSVFIIPEPEFKNSKNSLKTYAKTFSSLAQHQGKVLFRQVLVFFFERKQLHLLQLWSQVV